MTDTRTIRRSDPLSDWVTNINLFHDRDKGLFGDFLIWRYTGSEYVLDADNSSGNHMNLGSGSFRSTDGGTYTTVGFNNGPSVAGAATNEIFTGPDNTHRGIFTATNTVTAIGSRDNFPARLRTNNTDQLELSTAGHFSPINHNSQDLGLTGTRYRAGYFGTGLNVGAATGAATSEVLVGDNTANEGLLRSLSTGTDVGSKDAIPLNFLVGNAIKVSVDTSGMLVPVSTNTLDLGTTALAWRTAYLGTSLFVGDTTNANNTHGLTVNQLTADDEIVSLKSSDVAHGITGVTETDTYATMGKWAAADGGLFLQGVGGTSATSGIVAIAYAGTDNTARATTAVGYAMVDARLKSGTGTASPGTNANLFVVQSRGSARFLVDQEGDIHMDATSNINAWDDHDDVALLEAFRLTTMREEPTNFKRLFSEDITRHAQILHDTGVITLNEDGHHFVSRKGLDGLLIDSIRQLYGVLLETQAEVRMLRQRVLPGGA